MHLAGDDMKPEIEWRNGRKQLQALTDSEQAPLLLTYLLPIRDSQSEFAIILGIFKTYEVARLGEVEAVATQLSNL